MQGGRAGGSRGGWRRRGAARGGWRGGWRGGAFPEPVLAVSPRGSALPLRAGGKPRAGRALRASRTGAAPPPPGRRCGSAQCWELAAADAVPGCPLPSRLKQGSPPLVFAGCTLESLLFSLRLLKDPARVVPPHLFLEGAFSYGHLET